MDIFRVAFFGHKEIDHVPELERKLAPILKGLMREHPSTVEFYIGRNGEFDEIAASVIKRIRKESHTDGSLLILVLPYAVKNMEYYERYYDEIVIPEVTEKAHYKKAITLRNRWMVDLADLVIVNIEHRRGGAYAAMRYAQKQNKPIIHLQGEAFPK